MDTKWCTETRKGLTGGVGRGLCVYKLDSHSAILDPVGRSVISIKNLCIFLLGSESFPVLNEISWGCSQCRCSVLRS